MSAVDYDCEVELICAIRFYEFVLSVLIKTAGDILVSLDSYLSQRIEQANKINLNNLCRHQIKMGEKCSDTETSWIAPPPPP